MNGFFAENVGLFAEECYPYTGKHGQCHYNLNLPKNVTSKCDENREIVKVTRSYFVEPTETSIQKEIMKNGMVEVTWSYPVYAQHFGNGILKATPNNPSFA